MGGADEILRPAPVRIIVMLGGVETSHAEPLWQHHGFLDSARNDKKDGREWQKIVITTAFQ
ncbi:MAG: hypothetical protein DMF25_05195 [Verrucomicrobia bacterium]|nr:MAG: hypothetical protein DMF25_05195 [Verrucomicrobiota bacterium]